MTVVGPGGSIDIYAAYTGSLWQVRFDLPNSPIIAAPAQTQSLDPWQL